MKADRRGFLACVAASTVACSGRKSPWRFFTAGEARTIQAVCEQIVPTDQDPGAAHAGVVTFLDRQLTGFHKGLGEAYRAGIAEIDRAAVQRFEAGFADLDAPRQIEILKDLEKRRIPFFDLIVSHTMQGYYGSPRHGGNREAVSWKMLGVPYPPVRGRT